MSGKKFTYNPPAAKPKRPSAERVVSERGRKELPPGTRGGENLKPDRHYEHKQHAFDSYCKKAIKYEAWNAYTQIRRGGAEGDFSQLAAGGRNGSACNVRPLFLGVHPLPRGRGRDPD